jgi:hypothetical protein
MAQEIRQREQDARLAAGDERTLEISLANLGGLDLTDLQAHYVVARSPFDRPPLIAKQTGAGITIVGNPPALHVALKGDDTAALPPAVYYHEVFVVLADGRIVMAMSGELRLDPAPAPPRR